MGYPAKFVFKCPNCGEEEGVTVVIDIDPASLSWGPRVAGVYAEECFRCEDTPPQWWVDTVENEHYQDALEEARRGRAE